MRIELTLKNYRCFPDSSPARIVLDDGDWTAFLGVNNTGKSTLLRFFYEFRSFFDYLTKIEHWQRHIGGELRQFGYVGVGDHADVFHNQNTRPILIELSVTAAGEVESLSAPSPTSVTFEFPHEHPGAVRSKQVVYEGHRQFGVGGTNVHHETVLVRESIGVDVRLYIAAMKRLTEMLYVGAFRNVLNTGAKADYFDISVGDAFVKRWRNMQAGPTRSHALACNLVVAAIERLFGFSRLDVQASVGEDTLHLVIDGQPHKLPEVGAGLAQFILVLANAAVKRPSYILIDEPELNLHPSLQIDFLLGPVR